MLALCDAPNPIYGKKKNTVTAKEGQTVVYRKFADLAASWSIVS